jgi:arylsulfatase A-like enzyme
MADELRRSALGIYGNDDIHTPNLDRLGRASTRFDRACSTYAVCVPFRFTMMTGRPAHRRAVPALGYRMSPAERTLADEFKEAGYHNAYFGKWHLEGGDSTVPGGGRPRYGQGRPPKRLPRGHLRGWDHFLFLPSAGRFASTDYTVNEDLELHHAEEHQVDFLFRRTQEYLESERPGDRPFFCMVSTNAPHPPYTPGDEYLGRLRDRDIHLPPNVSTDLVEPRGNVPDHEIERFYQWMASGEIVEKHRQYYAFIERFDEHAGRLLDYLDESGLAQTTWVVLVADHGELLGNHGLTCCKQFPFEESIGIPFMLRPPGGSQGRGVRQPVHTEDIFPTLLGLAGLEPRDQLPGLNLAPYAEGEDPAAEREGVLLEFVRETRVDASLHGCSWRGVCTETHKYTVFSRTNEMPTPWHLYDLRDDPWEMHNLVDEPAHRAEVRRHHELLRSLLEPDDPFDLAPLPASYLG